MRPLPAFPLDVDPDEAEEISSELLCDDDEDRPTVRPPARSGVALGEGLDGLIGARAEVEWRLFDRGRFAPEHHKLSVPTLRRLDAMFDRLAAARSHDDAVLAVRAAFHDDEERRAALAPLLALLYPLGYFDERMPVRELVDLVARGELRAIARRA